jgi:long-chain fatty acid transport protein
MTAGASVMSKTLQFFHAARPLALAALTVAVVAALAVPRQADASAFQLKENSAKALGRAFAGATAAGDDTSVVVNNPAAMSMLKGTVFQADVTAINFSTEFSGGGHDAFGMPLTGGDGGDGGTTIPVPALFFATQVSDRWHLGVGFSAPFGFKTDWNRGWVGRYHGMKSDFQSLDATLSASFDVNDQFSLGVSAIAQKTSAELTSAINFSTVLASQNPALIALFPPQSADGSFRLKGDDWAYGWQIGALWKLTPNDRLAFNYRSKIDHTIEGSANYTVPQGVQQVLAMGGSQAFQHTDGKADFTTPAVSSLSYWHGAERFGFGIDLSLTQWDVFKELRIEYANPQQPDSIEAYNWRNSWFASVGGEYYASDKLTLRAGVAVDSTPTYEGTRSPRVPDSTRQWIALGLTYHTSDKFELSAGYAHIFVNHAHIQSTSPTGDVLTGNFKDAGNLLSLSATYSF